MFYPERAQRLAAMNAKPGHASYHLESQVDLQIAGDSICQSTSGQILVRYAGDGLAVICLTIMNEEVAAGLAKPISVEKESASRRSNSAIA